MGRDSILNTGRKADQNNSTQEEMTTDAAAESDVDSEPEPESDPNPDPESGSGSGSENSDSETAKLTQRMPSDLVEEVDEFADHYGFTYRNAAINFIVRDYLRDR